MYNDVGWLVVWLGSIDLILYNKWLLLFDFDFFCRTCLGWGGPKKLQILVDSMQLQIFF